MMKEQMNEEADYFARCLLMPKEKFVELFEKIKYVNRGKREADKINPIACLSSLFDVPVKQVIKRIEELDLKS